MLHASLAPRLVRVSAAGGASAEGDSPCADPWPVTLDGWLTRCERAHPAEIDLTLDRVSQVKSRLGLSFRVPVVTVAGTNGKGSTCSMLESIALAAGWRVGCYSKPHLVHFEERCRVNGQMVSADELVPHFRAVEEVRGDTTLTYFEHTTLAILRLLSMAPLELVILEVGLGGRLDAVNVIDAECAVITTIDIDHTDYLGCTRESIGREKAGIIRSGAPAIVGDSDPPASLLEHAKNLGAHLLLSGRDFRVEPSGDSWSWCAGTRHIDHLPLPALAGTFQVRNAAAALAALESLKALPFPSTACISKGLRTARLSGRFQVVPGAPRLVLDVAHNRQAADALAATLRSEQRAGRTLAVFGCMRDKDIGALIGSMADLVECWYFTDLPIPRAATATHLQSIQLDAGMSGDLGHPSSCWESPGAALRAALQDAREDDSIVVFGSFFTVAGVLRHLEESSRRGKATRLLD